MAATREERSTLTCSRSFYAHFDTINAKLRPPAGCYHSQRYTMHHKLQSLFALVFGEELRLFTNQIVPGKRKCNSAVK